MRRSPNAASKMVCPHYTRHRINVKTDLEWCFQLIPSESKKRSNGDGDGLLSAQSPGLHSMSSFSLPRET